MNAPHQKPLLEIRNLVVETDSDAVKRIVDRVSLSVRPGQVLGLIGESGAGKTTIGLAALGYARNGCRIASGSILFDGLDLAQMPEKRRRRFRGQRVSYVAQSAASALNPRISLMRQCVEVLLRENRITRSEAERRACELFSQLWLPDPTSIGERYPHQVSGGQLQRIMIAMAMLPNPELVVFDEPTTALDVTTQVEVLLAIRDLIRQFGSAAVYISHDLAVVAQLADEIAVLRDGRVVEYGSAAQLLNSPQTDYARALLNVRALDRAGGVGPNAPVLLEGARLCASYGSKAVLHTVDIHLCQGETIAVIGESGSGKTTLARVLLGLVPATDGVMRWKGIHFAKRIGGRRKEELRRLQFIHQNPDTALNPRHTARRVLERPLACFGCHSSIERRRRSAELLRLVELDPEEHLDRLTPALSGGEKQRLCIARALAAEPELIICDEITSALDPLIANGILRLLERLRSELGLSLLFITHDLATVRSIADRVVVMQAGRVVESGSVQQILAQPQSAYTRRLVSANPERRIGWLDEHIVTLNEGRNGNGSLGPVEI